jgi:hypothetical protein
MTLRQGVFLFSLCLLVVVSACRRNAPDLVDTNAAPETELWFAPPTQTEYEYLVHLFWRGVDIDGTTESFIWTITDTLDIEDETRWNPSARLRDLRSGHFISRTDTVLAFTAFRDVGGIGIRKNRQTFHIASIDDNGVIDPSPAAVEFVATIERLPHVDFTVWRVDPNSPDPGNPVFVPYPYEPLEVPQDTVGMFRPFQVSYHGSTNNGIVRGYRWRPLSTSIVIPGADVWTDDLSDTLRIFTNTGNDTLPATVFRLAAQCRDDAGAESPVAAGSFNEGVAQVVVNFDPDTRIHNIENTFNLNGVPTQRTIDFTDSVPDTVSYLSWVRIDYSGWDDDRDVKRCPPASINPDRCIEFQFRYKRVSSRVRGSREDSGWLPNVEPFQNSDINSATDSNSVNVGSLEYEFLVRALDENGTPDGSTDRLVGGVPVPQSRVDIVGNFDPTLDGVSVVDNNGAPIDLTGPVVDTLTWDWNSVPPVLDFVNLVWTKTFEWRIGAQGHDHPWDPQDSGVKSWRYFIFTDYGTVDQAFWPLARAGETWVDGVSLNILDDKFELTFRYPIDDTNADTIFDNLPGYFDETLTVLLSGRDTSVDEDEFEQIVFLDVDPTPGTPAVPETVNQFPSASFGRWTHEQEFAFYFRMVR